MFSLSGKVPGYLLGKYQMTTIVVLTLLFATLFLLIVPPFPENTFCILAALLLAASRALLYMVSKRSAPTYLKYIVWCVMEAILISFLYILLKGGWEQMPLFGTALAKTVFAMAPPHIIGALYFALQEKDNVIRLMNYGNVVTDEAFTAQNSQKITLFDNNGVMKLSITASNLYYIESDDNYIKVWFRDNDGVIKQYMLRCKLKTVEDSFADSDLVRCHRKYIINIRKARILLSGKDGYSVELESDATPVIPVSKTYEQAVLARFNSRQ